MKFNNVHFIAIGGIGMSAIAELLLEKGVKVQGSDIKEGANTKRLQEKGIPVFIGHSAENVKNAEVIVYSSAIDEENPEIIEARRRGLPIASRSEMLGEIMKEYRSIGVAGTHGKTSTSALMSFVLESAGRDPSFVVGGILKNFNTNAKLGKSDLMVVESCEYQANFMNLPSTISIVTNIDPEHMEYYQTIDSLHDHFRRFMQQTAFYGFNVVCIDHPVVKEVAAKVKNRKMITYGLDPTADYSAVNIKSEPGKQTFDVVIRQGQETITDVVLPMFGKHNVLNSLSVIAVSKELGLTNEEIKKGFADFEGIERRLSLRGTPNNIAIYDDYGHHPVEIAATLRAIKESAPQKVIAVFQPHRYSRLNDLWDDFMHAFDDADTLIVGDVFSAGTEVIGTHDSAHFAKEIAQTKANVHYLDNWDNLTQKIKEVAAPGDIVVCLGAGTISAYAKKAAQELESL